MLRIRVHENEQCVLEKRVPSELGETGCVVLLQETFVATLSVGGSVECGSFNVSLATEDDTPEDNKIAEHVDHQAAAGLQDTVAATDGEVLSNEIGMDSDDVTRVMDPSCRTSEVSLEVYARIPGYDLRALIGRGGMGLVWKAVQLSTNRMVAVKTIHPRMLNDPKSRKRFQREVELAARLTHPNIVRVYEAGEVAGQNYFSMELVDGVPWGQHVRSNQLTKSDVLQQLLQVLDAVAYAHTQGVVHRDLKPSNILVDKTGKVYVVDFGLAKYDAMGSEELSQQGDIIGTLTFMSPEQASGDVTSTDSRSDVYSLGAVVVYLLGNGITGQRGARNDANERSSQDGGLQKQAAAILRNDPRLRRILVKALAPQPDQRYENAGAFASDLRDYLEVRLTEVIRSDHQEKGENRKWWLAGAAMLLAAIGIGGFLIWRNKVSQSTTNSTQAAEVLADADPGDDETDTKQDKVAEREREVEAKFGNLFAASFQSTGNIPKNATMTSGVGHQDPADYPVVHPLRWPLVGFNLATYSYRKRMIIKIIQPVFRDPDSGATETSEMFGRLHPKCEYHQVLARPGFHVVGLEGVGGTRLHALRVSFAEAAETEPDVSTTSSYQSPWFGEPLNDPTETLGDSGAAAIGIVCSFSADIHQVGLILDEPGDAP